MTSRSDRSNAQPTIGNVPAFPHEHFDLAGWERGMTLRDYFAAKAMQPQIAAIVEDRPIDLEKAIEMAARGSYKVADAMLKARGSDGSP